MRSQGDMYKVTAQPVLLCGSESWVVNGGVLKVLEVFHHRTTRRITGMKTKFRAGREWEYPLVVEALKTTGLHIIRVYIRRQQATVAESVACRPIYELCTEAGGMPGTSRMV